MTCHPSRRRPHATLGCLAPLIIALSAACVAKDSDTLGELDDASTSAATQASGQGSDAADDGNDDGVTSGASDGADAADDAATTAMTTDSDDGNPPPLECEPGLTPAGPASCPQGLGLELSEPGCFEECEAAGDACAVGTCQLVEYDPCPCPEGAEACCGACAAEIWLCVEDVVDAFCEAIVGTRFESIEEFECGLGKDGPVLCHWAVDFGEDGIFLWTHSDVGEGGEYTCEDGVLTIDPRAGLLIDFSYDPKTETLTWEGVDYRPAAG